PAADRSYSWTIPSTVTNNALIRISRNGTALTDQSNFNFSVLGRPSLTVTRVCEGSVLLSWHAVAGATSYDALQLVGDSMQVIGNTTDTSILIKGLNKYSVSWFGVAAKNGTIAGRRSLSVSSIPNSGPCTLA